MRKNAFVLSVLALALAVVGCKPRHDDPETGSNDVAGSAGKSLVKKMEIRVFDQDTVDDYEVDGSATLSFSYEEGRLASITGTGEYEYRDDYDVETMTGTATVGFEYAGEKIDVSLSLDATVDYGPDGTDHASGRGTMELQMNADKAVASSRTLFGSGDVLDEYLVGFEYTDKYLTRLVVPYWPDLTAESYGLEYGWENGNIVRVGSYDDYGYGKHSAKGDDEGRLSLQDCMVRLMFPLAGILSSPGDVRNEAKSAVDWYDDYHLVYTAQENKSNLDFASLVWTFCGGIADYSQFLGVLGFTGTMSRNLPESLYEDDEYEPDGRWEYGRVEYTFNNQDLVTDMRVYDEEGEQLGTIRLSY